MQAKEREEERREGGREEGGISLPKINSSSLGSSKTSMSLTTLGWSNFFKMAISLPMLSSGVLTLLALAPGFGHTEWRREEDLGHRQPEQTWFELDSHMSHRADIVSHMLTS